MVCQSDLMQLTVSLFFLMPGQQEIKKYCLLMSQKCRSDKPFCLLFSVDTLSLLHCVGVVSPGNFLSVEGFGSDSATSETCWVSVSNFARGVVSYEISLW